MDLPTYTNIWRIEKRLYKLYDLRLPMPLPLVQIGVFAGVFVPWILLLKVAGIPFESPWHVLYIVPPGVLTWLATRPVIEGKRLTELLLSQSRYLAEPRTWCRLTPIREPREVVVVARVWRRPAAPAPVAAPERAAIKSRRRTRAAQAAVPTAATMLPRPDVASAPLSLAEYAAQRDGEHTLPDPMVAPPVSVRNRQMRVQVHGVHGRGQIADLAVAHL
ncbi:conjugal transfer protein, partial [Actinomadura fibrosa]|uniref:conjugal transfer protein n=1 Tax=Actinomadura fibrosa TaxID=111802 RepID=UPI001041098F